MQENNFNNINPEKTQGSVSGFDFVGEQGYTVTPEGGFYNRSSADIIQDEPIKREEPDFAINTDSNEAYYSEPKFVPKEPPKKPKKQAPRVSVLTVVICLVVALTVGAVSGAGASMFFSQGGVNMSSENSNGEHAVQENVNITIDDKNVSSVAQAVAEKCSNSVVGIRTTTAVADFFGGISETPGEGSGVIYSEDGYIITNYHVVETAVNAASSSKIEVFLNNLKDTPYSATVVGYNISSDLAVLKINADNLKAVEIGDSDELSVGQYVVTIGSPGGLEFMGSVTYGIISGLDRVVSSNLNVELIQIDAAINPGNSGGALLDATGKLIGINSSKIVAEEFEGMGFAIPVNTVVQKVDKIISRQNEPEPYIGITISERYSSEVLAYYGYPAGAVVLSVDEGSPAEKSGIKRGDIITEVNGNEIKEYQFLSEYLSDATPGEEVEVTLYRSGRYYNVKIKVEANS